VNQSRKEETQEQEGRHFVGKVEYFVHGVTGDNRLRRSCFEAGDAAETTKRMW
jgi:hypothetical protein